MSFEPEDLAQSIRQWTTHIEEQKQRLEAEVRRIKVFQRDYDALEKQLQTLPDETTRAAMIPIGSLAFMPGKLIHTNEITVYLGADYYVERSAKQALTILNRRREDVNENLRLVEAQLNGLTAKKDSSFGVFPSNELGVNDEGLPIMEIREELPEEEHAQKFDKALPAIQEVVEEKTEKPLNEDKAPAAKAWEDKEYKDMMAMLQKLEEEEEEEMAKSTMQESVSEHNREDYDEDEDEDEDQSDREDDDYMDNLYDTDIADNLFDQFDDDEEYATEGIVEYEDASVYEEEGVEDVKTTIAKDDVEDEIPILQSVRETQPKTSVATTNSIARELSDAKSEAKELSSKPRKASFFKAAREKELQQTQQAAVILETPSVPTVLETIPESSRQDITAEPSTPIKEASRFNATTVEEEHVTVGSDRQIPVVEASTPPQKISRFKAARQQEKASMNGPPTTTTTLETSTDYSSPVVAKDRVVQGNVSTAETKSQVPFVEASTPQKKISKFKAARQQEQQQQTSFNNSSKEIPPVVTSVPERVSTTETQITGKNNQKEMQVSPRITTDEAAVPKKKPSRFKAAREQKRSADGQTASPIEINPAAENPSEEQTIQGESAPSSKAKSKRRVTWDEVATVQEHDRFAAPADVTSDAYMAPVKQGEKIYKAPQTVKSPADIFNLVQAQRQAVMDDGYPSLETGEDDFEVDMDDLGRAAKLGKQELWQLKDESEPPLMIKEIKEAKESSLPVVPKTKLDTKVMRGAVIEHDIEPVDLEEVEMDMDFREVTSSYHTKRNNFVAAMGGFTFEPKDTIQVFDEELPLPSKGKKKEDEVPEEKPKKMSRFKAARMAAFDKEQHDEYTH